MSNIDNELLQDAEDDARAIEFIQNYLPQELKEKFTEDELYYFLDLIIEYYATNDVFNAEPDADGYIEIDLNVFSGGCLIPTRYKCTASIGICNLRKEGD